MFEYAIAQHRKRPPSRRFFACVAASCALHFVAVVLLIEYPQLLSPGLNRWFRQPALIAALFSRESDQQGKESSWRTVAVLGKSSPGKMTAPSAATLRQYMYDWSKQGNGVPPVRVRWGNEQRSALEEASTPKPKPVPGFQEPKRADTSGAEKQAAAPVSQEPTAAGGGGSGSVQVAETAGRGTVYLPAPQPGTDAKSIKKAPELSSNTAPTSIPSGISTPTPAPAASAPKTANPVQAKTVPRGSEDEQKAIRTEGSGLFDTRGFPLGEYADIIIKRVEGNWFIPSNMRRSQGRTTVIFYIERNGGYSNLHIVAPSGSSSLDLAALNAVMESKPFPPLPKDFPAERVGAKFVFSYNERQ